MVVGLILSSPRFASAAEWSIISFHSDISVKTNASIDVHETIRTQFTAERHGIFRTIPINATFNNRTVRLPITNIQAQQDGHAIPVAITTEKNKVRIKIGDPDLLIRGVHSYDITYHVDAAVNFFSDFDELNWNVSGNEWEVPLQSVTATLRLPNTDAVPTILCYTGTIGSKEQQCSGIASAGKAEYSATTPLTVISHWQKGVVTKPDSYDRTRNIAASEEFLWVGSWVVAILLSIIAFLVMWQRWLHYGKDPDEPETVIAQYEPPSGLLPAEATVVDVQKLSPNAISATIIDLAVRGYLRIEEREQQKLLGKKKDFALYPVKDADESLRDYERKLLDMLFATAEAQDETKTTLLSAMKKHSTKMEKYVEEIKALAVEGVHKKGYFVGNPVAAVAKYTIVGSVMVAIPIYLFISVPSDLPGWGIVLLGGMLAAGISIGGFGMFMSRRTESGAKAHWHVKGFKLYLKTAEQYRLQWQEKEHIFEKFLPYAIAFGITEKWAQTFAEISMPKPTWYSGTGDWNSIYAWHALNSFADTFTTATVPSNGGSSSGGFGGGGGGGGGGSW